ncbi:hypothetical protein FDB55_03395 [Clostridium botulinum]|nr:hypothetical protein [Clostridium botulinum]NFN20791.1 hypothetical protein [Clostridium botulinum]NFN42009.1 hypothetical protein [Clostridium botulinum]
MAKNNNKFERIFDYINIKNREVKVSVIFTIILMIIAEKINLYENFEVFKPPLENITIYIASGLLGLIGIMLTGLALIIGILDKMFVKQIRDRDNDLIEEVMSCFIFLIFNLGVACVVFFSLHLLLYMNIYIDKLVFNIIIVFCIYYFNFLVFYTIDLIATSIDLFLFKNINQDINNIDKINEYIEKVKIEYLMRNSTNRKSYDKFFQDIDDIVDAFNDNIDDLTKAKIKKIFREIYRNKD